MLQQALEAGQHRAGEALGLIGRERELQVGCIELTLDLQHQVAQCASHLAARLWPLIPDLARRETVALVPVAQFQRAGSLAGTGHAMEERGAQWALWGQCEARAQHGSEPAVKAGGLGRKAHEPGLGQRKPTGRPRGWDQGEYGGAGSKQDGGEGRERRVVCYLVAGPGLVERQALSGRLRQASRRRPSAVGVLARTPSGRPSGQ